VPLTAYEKPLVAAWNEYESRRSATAKLKNDVAAEGARLRKVQDSAQDAGISVYQTGSPLDRDIRALGHKKEELRFAQSQASLAKSKFESLARVQAVFTRQVYGGMAVWRVVERNDSILNPQPSNQSNSQAEQIRRQRL
jgi:hypothetical protein